MGCIFQSRTVGAGTGVGHAEGALAVVPQRRDKLVLELAAPDGRATTASTGGITALNHEALDDTVEDHVVVFAGCGKSGEVLAGLEYCQLLSLARRDAIEAHLGGLVLEQSNSDVSESSVKSHALSVGTIAARLRRGRGRGGVGGGSRAAVVLAAEH